MNNTPDSTLHLVGLKGTGKTNFLVALDVVLDDQADGDGLVHSEFTSDRAYLQPLKEKWLRGEVFLRTSRQSPPPPHQLIVRHPVTEITVGLNVPDLAGETFESYFVTRTIPQDLWERLQKASGLLLFVHCDHNADHTILEHPCFIDAQPAELRATAFDPSTEWQLENASMQVKLVDLLQFLMEGPIRKPLRIAVVVSAWDKVDGVHRSGQPHAAKIPNDPSKFLQRCWPLLYQFLTNNSSTFMFRVFGVSARGGGDTKEDIARLTNLDRPSSRIILVDGEHRSNDVTRPIRWLLDLNPKTANPPNV